MGMTRSGTRTLALESLVVESFETTPTLSVLVAEPTDHETCWPGTACSTGKNYCPLC